MYLISSHIDRIHFTEYCNRKKLNCENITVKDIIINAKTSTDIDLNNVSDIFINCIDELGHSTFFIFKMIKALKDKKITLHMIDREIQLHLNNETLFAVLESLLEFESSRIEHRTNLAKATREKKNIRLGRKRGSTGKSKYDKHKKRILYLHKLGVSNKKIVEDINIGTPQSLGKYIKQKKLDTKRKQQANGTYLVTEENLANINKFGS